MNNSRNGDKKGLIFIRTRIAGRRWLPGEESDKLKGKKYQRVPIVGVIGAGKPGVADILAYELGKLVARAGYVLLSGGGGGVMAAASRGAAEEGGLVVGILPSESAHDPRHAKKFPNPHVHIPIYTGMSDARNVINIKSSDIIVALPGGAGTLSELGLALKREKTVIVLGWEQFRLPFKPAQGLLHQVQKPEKAVEIIKSVLPLKKSN